VHTYERSWSVSWENGEIKQFAGYMADRARMKLMK